MNSPKNRFTVKLARMHDLAFIIWAPSYSEQSAGVRCLYMLCDELNRRKAASWMTGGNLTTNKLQSPLLTLAQARRRVVERPNTVAIYPETVIGNPLGAQRVIRWVLNRPGLLGGTHIFNPNEKVFYYSEAYLPYISNEIAGKLYLPTLDETLFSPGPTPTSERSLVCFYVGKSVFKSGHFNPEHAFEITRSSPRRENLPRIFQASRILYSFDNSTALIYEAALCGCPAVVIPDGTQTREDYEHLELGLNGIAWGSAELDRATTTTHLLRAQLANLRVEKDRQIDQLVDLCLAWQSSPSPQSQLHLENAALHKKIAALEEHPLRQFFNELNNSYPALYRRMVTLARRLRFPEA